MFGCCVYCLIVDDVLVTWLIDLLVHYVFITFACFDFGCFGWCIFSLVVWLFWTDFA